MRRAHGNRCDLGPLRVYLIAAGAMVVFVLSATQTASQQDRPPTPEDWQKAERDIKRVPPSAFKELPMAIVKQLEARGCTIPQAADISEPHNVIRGEFAQSGQMDWAVLCSKEGKSSILIFWQKPTACSSELPASEDKFWLQGLGQGRIGYSRKITAVGKKYVLDHFRTYGGPTPPALDHEGIDDAFVEKASVVHYCHQGKWLDLQGAD